MSGIGAVSLPGGGQSPIYYFSISPTTGLCSAFNDSARRLHSLPFLQPIPSAITTRQLCGQGGAAVREFASEICHRDDRPVAVSYKGSLHSQADLMALFLSTMH